VSIELDVTPGEPAMPSRPAHRRRRWLVAGVVVVVIGAAATAVVLGSPPPPTPPLTTIDLDGRLGWVEKLVDAPPRGAVAGDGTFTRELTDRVTQLIRAGTDHRHLTAVDEMPHPDQDVKLIYADDIDDRRIVLLALRLPYESWTSAPAYPEPLAMRGRIRIVWVSGPRGSSPGYLTAAFNQRPPLDLLVGSMLPSPLLVATVGAAQWLGLGATGCDPGVPCTMVALTPPGCTIATAAHGDPSEFRDAPDGSYLVRTAATYRFERWRVTCDGVVREEGFASPMWRTDPPSDEAVDAALETSGLTAVELASGDARNLTFQALAFMQAWTGLPMTEPARVRWTGRLPDARGLDHSALALVAVARVGSLWLAGYSVVESADDGTEAYSVGSYLLDEDPTASGRMVAIPIEDGILAIPPPGAATVRYVRPGTGATTESPVVGGVALLPAAPASRLLAGQIKALDAAGTPVAVDVGAVVFGDDFIAYWS
jgi:hypothetical protein